jgi:hypothetical protein
MAGSKRRLGPRKGDAPAEPPHLAALRAGAVIPAHPLALTAERKLDERRQRALSRYYIAVGLLRPVLEIAAEEMNRADVDRTKPLIRVAGICGNTGQSVREAEQARDLGYTLGLVSLAAFGGASIGALVDHCRAVAGVIDLFGFYLQPAVGGIELPFEFWRHFCEIPNARAIKIATFDRYRTLTVIRAVAESGRDDIALYTGNDDNIINDLVTPYEFGTSIHPRVRYIVGGLLGQWAVWTSKAFKINRRCRLARGGRPIRATLLKDAAQLTDANAAIFDAANNFRGCVPGIHEILRRQGLLQGIWCLDENETLSQGQSDEIARVTQVYPHLTDDPFVEQHRDDWLSG